MSAHIKALEEDLGVTLFARSAKGMALSREGEALLPLAEAMLRQADELRRTARSLSREVRGELRLALHTDPQFLRILPLLELMRATHPALRPRAAPPPAPGDHPGRARSCPTTRRPPPA